MRTALIMLLCALSASVIAEDKTVARLLKDAFGPGFRIENDTFTLTEGAITELGDSLGSLKNPIIFSSVFSGDSAAGYLFQTSEKGKFDLHDFAVLLDNSGSVLEVRVTAYRSSVGGEIRSKHFLRQFIGKDDSSQLRLNSDINGLTGATLSSRAAVSAVKKATRLWKRFYKRVDSRVEK